VRYLLDTHTLVWWWIDDARLPQAARTVIATPGHTIIVSAVSAIEISTKHHLGKWPDVARIVADFEGLVRRSRFGTLPITLEHGTLAGSLAWAHRDPFDRLLLAQSRHENLQLISGDPVFRAAGAPVIWD
jgi:PIN domain nuclease of toxin-antitoxin system